jgi:Uma2 family endonuclease
MNAPTIIANQKPKISVADLFHLMETGVMDPEAKFELIEGGIVPMSPQGPLHQDIQNWLAKQFERKLGDRYWVSQGATLILPDHTGLDPDICIFPIELSANDLSGDKVALVVEISVTSKAYDLGQKASLYARMAVPELWVIDATARTTHVHRGPHEGGWREILRVPADGVLSLVAAPDLAMRIADAG